MDISSLVAPRGQALVRLFRAGGRAQPTPDPRYCERASHDASGGATSGREGRTNYPGANKEGVMIDIRKIVTMREMVLSELGVAAPRPIVRAVGMAVILNPFAGRFVDDLRPLFEAGAMLGERLMPDLV